MAETPGTSRLPTMPPDDPQASLRIIDRWTRDTVAPYIPYTPVITGTSGAFALGTGATLLGRYKRAGSRCNVEIRIFFGNPGFVPGGATDWDISLPVLPKLADLPIAWGNKMIGPVYISTGAAQDTHTALAHKAAGVVVRSFQVLISSAVAGQRLTGAVGIGNVGGIGPAPLNNNSSLFADLSYECAP